jgi:hypothetical protein
MAFRRQVFMCLALLFLAQANIGYARDEECSFTVRPVSVCEISFFKLLANPEKYDKKYISVKGYMAIDNGRLAVYPNDSSFSLDIAQDSFTISIPYSQKERLAHELNKNNIRIVGLFNYSIIGDKPGFGYLSKLIDAHAIGPRPDVPEDRHLSVLPEELPNSMKKH